MLHDASPDSDSDGLTDRGEFVIGTSAYRFSTAGDSISDGEKIANNLNPFGLVPSTTGVFGAITVPGVATDVAVSGGLGDLGKFTAYVSTGDAGLSIVDVSAPSSPVLSGSVDLPGNNVGVAADATRGLVAVAASAAGLHIVSIANPSKPTLVQTVSFTEPVTRVAAQDGIAYAAAGSHVALVDLSTGDVSADLDLSTLGGTALTDLSVVGSTLYTMDTAGTLRTIAINGDVLTPQDSLAVAGSGGKLFVGGGLAYVGSTRDFSQGFSSVDVSNPADIKLLSGIDAANVAGQSLASTGSGLLVTAGNLRGPRGEAIYAVDVLNGSDPTNTGAFVTRINLPAAPKDLVLANGLAFVADGSGGLQIVNYAAFDNKGVKPTATISVSAVDADSNTDGVQVLEGRSLRVTPVVADDVQVRNVELLVNGVVVANDVSFPHEFFADVPTIAAGGSTVTVQVRATDTGGNVGLSNLLTLSLVKDTVAPVASSVSIANGDKRFIVRSVDLVFDEQLDLSKLDASKVELLRAGADGVFGTADDVRVPVRLDARAQGQRLSVLVDTVLPQGDYRLTIDKAILADKAGNGVAASIVRTFSIRPASDVKATSGTPEIPTAPSANPAQRVGFTVPFDPSTARAEFNVIDDSGNVTKRTLEPAFTDAATSKAYFKVPLNAVTGDIVIYKLVGAVRTDFADGTLPLQIVPVVTNATWSVSIDGTTATLTMDGLGFVEGGNSQYRFGTEVVSDTSVSSGPSVSGRGDAVLGFVPNGRVSLTLPLTDGVFAGAFSVKTAGGTSAPSTNQLTAVVGVALSGTPANAALPSANAGQAVTLQGTGLALNSGIVLDYINTDGASRAVMLNPSTVAADGRSATLVVPQYMNGIVRVRWIGSSEILQLQIVPTVTAYDMQQDRLVLFGSGFVEGDSRFDFGGVTAQDSAAAGNDIDIRNAENSSVQNGSAYINRTALPRHGFGLTTVTTAGGTSAPVSVPELRLSVAGTELGDVAVDALGKLWVSDYASPGKLLKIEPSTGATLASIDYTAAFGTSYGYRQTGLQVLATSMTLGSTSVPAGSLLVFNGNPNPNRVIALNPADGTVIATLRLAGNYSLTAGLYDAASGKLFITSGNSPYNQLLQINAVTGALEAAVALPIYVNTRAGLAVDPVSGNLWVGSSDSTEIIEITRTGAEVRRVDLTPQGPNQQEISGLAFAADGELLVSSSQGVIYKVNTHLDAAAITQPTLTGVVARTTSGVAANPSLPATHVGEVIEVTGTNFNAGTRVLFQVRDTDGTVSTVAVEALVVNATGTRMQVQVPDLATTGDIRVVNQNWRQLGGGSTYADGVYRNVTVQFKANASTSQIRFADGGLEGLNNESWGLDNVRVSQGATTIFSDNFENGASPKWSDGRIDDNQIGNFSRYSGRFSSESQTLNLTGLTAGQTYTLTFDLLVLDSWDGISPNNGPDLLDVNVDGTSVFRENFASNYADIQGVQSYNTSAPIRLQIVPTLTGTSDGTPGSTNPFNLNGSGFMEGASTVTIGGIAVVDNQRNTTPYDVTGTRNNTISVIAPLVLDGPIRITTEGGYAELAAPTFGQQPQSTFTGITSTLLSSQAADPAKPAQVTGGTITLAGQGFSNNTLIQFQGVDDSGRLGTITVSPRSVNGSTQMQVTVPALARSGAVTVLGSGASFDLQVVPRITAVAGTVVTGNTLLISGSGLNPNDLAVTIGGRAAGNVSVRTFISTSSNPAVAQDQQLLTVTVPTGVVGSDIVVSTRGGSATARVGAVITARAPLTPAADAGNDLTTALPLTLGADQRQVVNSAIDGALAGFDVDLYKFDLNSGDVFSFSASGSLDTRVRLFDASGNQLSARTFAAAGTTTTISYNVPSNGTYYVGVSGSANTNYNPGLAGSGSGNTTGTYALTLERLGASSTRLSGITATAASGTAANGALPSANTGQSITLSGSGIVATDQVVFTTIDTAGNLGAVTVTPAVGAVNVGAQTITVTVPDNATTGAVRLSRDGAGSGLLLQVVPTLSDVAFTSGSNPYVGGRVTLSGSGFAEGLSSVSFGNQRLDDWSPNYGLEVFNGSTSNSRLDLRVPATTPALPTGPIRVTTLGGTSAAFGLSLATLSATATGTPANPALASAIPGQTITLTGTLLDLTTDIVFDVIDASGIRSERVVNPSAVNAGGTVAQVVVPLNAVTGNVRAVGDINGTALLLQILPVISSVQVERVSADGKTAQLLLAGLGFVEGGNAEYRIGSEVVLDAGSDAGPDVLNRNDSQVGFLANGYVRLIVPVVSTAFGAISVKTAGGTSAAYSVNLASITATASSGTPTDASKASANAGQTVTLVGSGLSTSSDVLMAWTDINGAQRIEVLNPTAAAVNGSSATLVLPTYANGAPQLRLFGSASAPVLQIVPKLTAYDVQDRVVLFGSGLIEGNGSYQFAGVRVDDKSDDPGNVDVYYSTANSFQNGSVYINRTALPAHGMGAVSVTTAGGTSAPLDLNALRVTVAGTSLGDLAVDADGNIWVSDDNNPGQLAKISPANGGTLATIDYSAAFGQTYSYNLAGLQVLTSAMTLGSTSVPAGSLLLFNGSASPDRVVALNPTTGAVLSTLNLAGNYNLTAGVFDASTGKIFVLENSPGTRMLQINATTGALEAAITVPLSISSWAGLAVSPVSGNLWIGSTASTFVVEMTRTGAEVRRIDLSAQGVNQNEISGLSFLPDGRLLVASTQGEVYRVVLP